jgi:acetylornithine deacetylase/succinyl-diaminopimelate desuccinylase-like protein
MDPTKPVSLKPTDGKYLRIAGIPTFGVSALFGDPDDFRAHGRDERVRVDSFDAAVDFMYSLIRDFGGGAKDP